MALAIESKGHEVKGVDPSPEVQRIFRSRRYPHLEEGVQELLLRSRIRLVEMAELVAWAEIVFVAVQTPHRAEFEGVTPLTDERADFDYTALRQAMQDISRLVEYDTWSVRSDARVLESHVANVPTVAIVSTVLPGTFEREIKPFIDDRLPVVYNPSFIAMGTTLKDFLSPEFVLIGDNTPVTPEGFIGEEPRSWRLQQFYELLLHTPSEGEIRYRHPAEIVVTDITTAELIKVGYNAVIGQKIVLANALMEIAHKVGANADDVHRAFSKATRRIASSAYMRGGMGDGGACHPRDNIALSWLAREIGLSYDVFGSIMEARQAQTAALAAMAAREARERELRVIILGKAYKPGTNLTYGSAARLLDEFLPALAQGGGPHYDPLVDADQEPPLEEAAVFLVATQHPHFACYDYPAGSVIIDPFRYVPDKDGCTVVRIGEGRRV